MAPKIDDDPVTTEYDVYMTPEMEEQVFLLSFLNRPCNRPYSRSTGAAPSEMRIKPESGYLELDVKLNTQQNFNKFRGLQWGEALRASKQLHNSSGTYGPAAGLAMTRPKGAGPRVPLLDRVERDSEARTNLDSYARMERENQVFNKQVLGGQIIRHGAPSQAGKPLYCVGAFDGDRLHLTKVTGTVRMTPKFHHVDAEDDRNRIAAVRSQAEAGESGPPPVARALQARFMQEDEKDSQGTRMKRHMEMAEKETWINLEYVDEDDDEAYETYRAKFFTPDADLSTAPVLRSKMDTDAYLDAHGTRRDSSTKTRKRAPRRKGAVDVEIDDDDAEEAEDEDEDVDDVEQEDDAKPVMES